MKSLLSATLPAALLLAAQPALAAGDTAQGTAASPAVDPRAVSALDASRRFLQSLSSFEVRAEVTVQDVLDADTKVDTVSRVRYEYRAPDRLFAIWQSDRQERRLYFDGSRVTIFAPRVGYFATAPTSGSVADLFKNAAANYGIVFPLPDLFYWATANSPPYAFERAMSLGPADIAGTLTDQFLFRQTDTDWQIWIERGERPLPRKVVITDRSDPNRPSTTILMQWNPNVPLTDDRFAFTPPAGAQPIELARLSSRGERP